MMGSDISDSKLVKSTTLVKDNLPQSTFITNVSDDAVIGDIFD